MVRPGLPAPRLDLHGLMGRVRWREALESRALMGGGYILAAALTALSIAIGSSPPATGPLGPASQIVLGLLSFNLVLILALAGLMAWRVVRLFYAPAGDAGARLHLRFMALFSIAAVAPAVVVAFFFGVLVTRGVDSWFSERVRTVVENSATVARSYVDDQKDYIRDHIFLMAQDLNRAAPAMQASPVSFSHFLAYQASYHAFPAVYLIDKEGRILSRAEAADAPPFLAPPPASIAAADEGAGDIITRIESADLIRAIFRLKAYPEAYLYVIRPVEKGIINHLRDTEGSLMAYREAEQNRARIQAAFGLSYIETALLVLVGAVWLGLAAASSLSEPIGRLVKAAGKVAAGDLSARVDEGKDPEEIAVLTRAFNSMTADLGSQQEALRAASAEAESRRQFIETVLAGVSAGVIGLDAADRVSAANQQAAILLGLPQGLTYGAALEEVAPELVAVAARARALFMEAEEELDVVRGDEARRLRVRATNQAARGLVLTFDDITRLAAAQRNAAWKDVARRIAHEIKNPLTPIQLSAERLRRKYRGEIKGDLEIFDRCTDTIVRQVGDIRRMVDEFSAFARMPAPNFAAQDARELLRRAVFAQRVADPEVTVELVEPAAPVELVCDGRMVGQALINVLKNAGEAIATRRAAGDATPGRIVARLIVGDDQLCFEVEDNGVGLPAKDRGRLTEPYVTTREKGTGLGLAIVKRILEDHGGELRLTDARDGRGALALMNFPLSAREAAPRAADAELA